MIRFEPTHVSGKLWRIDLCNGNRKKGTFRAVPITDAVYTLAQAQVFCSNNRVKDYAHLLPDVIQQKQPH